MEGWIPQITRYNKLPFFLSQYATHRIKFPTLTLDHLIWSSYKSIDYGKQCPTKVVILRVVKKTQDSKTNSTGRQCNSAKTSVTVYYPCGPCERVYRVHSYFWMYFHSGCNYSWNAQESEHFQCGSSCCPDVSTASRREYTWRLALHHWAGTSPCADQTPLLRRIDLKGKLLPLTFTHDFLCRVSA